MASTLKVEDVIPTIVEVYYQNLKCFPDLSEEFRYIMVKKKLLKDYKLVVLDENLDEILGDQENVRPIVLKKPAFKKPPRDRDTRKTITSFTFKDIAQIETKSSSARKAIPRPIYRREDIPLLRLFENKDRKEQLKREESLSKIPRWSPKKTEVKASPKNTKATAEPGRRRKPSVSSPVQGPPLKRMRFNETHLKAGLEQSKSSKKETYLKAGLEQSKSSKKPVEPHRRKLHSRKRGELKKNSKYSSDIGSILDLINLDDITCDLENFRLV